MKNEVKNTLLDKKKKISETKKRYQKTIKSLQSTCFLLNCSKLGYNIAILFIYSKIIIGAVMEGKEIEEHLEPHHIILISKLFISTILCLLMFHQLKHRIIHKIITILTLQILISAIYVFFYFQNF